MTIFSCPCPLNSDLDLSAVHLLFIEPGAIFSTNGLIVPQPIRRYQSFFKTCLKFMALVLADKLT